MMSKTKASASKAPRNADSSAKEKASVVAQNACKPYDCAANAPTIVVGAVGYKFKKDFPGYGVFEGEVVEVRPGAELGRDRRCRYTDGDVEDLSLVELHELAFAPTCGSSEKDSKQVPALEKKRKQQNKPEKGRLITEKLAERKSKKNKNGGVPERKSDTNIGATEKQMADADHGTYTSPDHFSTMNELVPIDTAAEATMVQTKSTIGEKIQSASDKITNAPGRGDDRETDLWLTKVASMLGAGLPSAPQRSDGFGSKTPRSAQSQAGDTMTKCSSLPSREEVGPPQLPSVLNPRSSSPSSSVSIDCLLSLADLKRGVRHGTKVFQLKDPDRLVGEVILELTNGYVEVAIKGSLVKDRVSSFVVAPDESSVGDQVSGCIPLPPTLVKITKKNCSSTQGSEAASASTSAGTGLSSSGHFTRQSPTRGDISPAKKVKYSESPVCAPSKANAGSTEKIAPSSVPDSKLLLDSLFYWCCERCTMTNQFLRTRCRACQKRTNTATQRSALLEIASAAVAAAESENEAKELIPVEHDGVIPSLVLSQLFAASQGKLGPSPPTSTHLTDTDLYFYWICGLCTRRNSYKRLRCESCEVTKRCQSTPSALLEIALAAAQDARTTDEAVALIPCQHKPAIPVTMIASLVTCTSMAGRKPNRRRCMKSRLPGMDYCATHCDPMTMTAASAKVKSRMKEGHNNSAVALMVPPPNKDFAPIVPSVNITGGRAQTNLRAPSSVENRGAVTVIKNTAMFFLGDGADSLVNHSDWCVESIEDGILCQETRPFPLGLLVRRFFPGYGFHDGRIYKVLRQHIQENGVHRPVLVYRVLYSDGDNEDLMHHEISSLRQFYDRCKVKSTDPPTCQLVRGTFFETQKQGFIKIVRHSTPAHAINKTEGGIAHVQFCKIGQPWAALEIELMQVQLNVVRKLQPYESVAVGPAGATSVVDDEEIPEFDNSLALSRTSQEPEGLVSSRTVLVRTEERKKEVNSPLLEWPGFRQANSTVNNTRTENEYTSLEVNAKDDSLISPDLWLSRSRHAKASDSRSVSSFPDATAENDVCVMDDDSCVRHDVSGDQNGWDPAHAFDFVSWDPFGTVSCELCEEDTNEHQILICDRCHLGFHMYCVRPVIVNVPTSEWLCSGCVGGNEAGPTFSTLLEELLGDVKEVSKYLGLTFTDPLEFSASHKDALDLFSPKVHPTRRQAILGVARSKPTTKIGSLFISCNIHKNDWVIPLPISEPNVYTKSLAGMVAAMKYCGMESYSEDLIYRESIGASEDMNDASLDRVEPLSQRNLDIFNEYKANVKQGAYPPINIVHDEKVGFSVEALTMIPRHTLISEYVGEVTTVERSGETSSDSLMILLDTGDPKTSLLVDPTRGGNVARFLSGINNRSHVSRRKANVRTRRFVLNGKCRVALFTSKRIEPGDKLHYDYNAGVEGKTVMEWAKTGFYDTSNFF